MLNMLFSGGPGEGFWENSRKDTSVPGVVRQDGLVVVLQEVPHLVQDVEPPVVQDLRQVGHAAHVHPLSCHKEKHRYYESMTRDLLSR